MSTETNRNRLLSVDQGMSSSGNSDPSSSRSSRSLSTPQSRIPDVGSNIPIRLYAPKVKSFVDGTALITDELHENWISKVFVDSLGLTPKENTKIGIGKFDRNTFRFGEIILVSWSWKGAAQSGQTKQVVCHVVPSTGFQIMLKQIHFDPLGPKTSPVTLPQIFNRSISISPEIPRLDSGTISPPATILSDVQTEGFIDDSEDYGEFCSDVSDDAKAAESWMRSLELNVHRRLSTVHRGTTERIRITILDTGIDHSHPSIKALKSSASPVRVECKSFVGGYADDRSDESTKDIDGHGTHIAVLVSKIAPCADLYIAKISEKKVVPLENRIAEAIRWAAGKNVDIISMSFGFHEQHDSIQQAIDEISSSDCERKILMFAAASNRGIGFKPTFPSNHPSVTCVYATDGDGNKYRRNPQPISRRSPRFATLGVAVRSACIKGGEVRKSGTSFATPVAAAIAALVLEFAIKNDMESKVYHKKLKTKEGMEKIFATMVTENDNVDFIYPWKLWHVKRRDTSVLDEMYQALAP